jgi:putative endopeptidase
MKSILLVAASAAALSLSVSAAVAATAPAPAAATAPSDQPKHYGKWGIDLTARDTTVKPGDDFFSYNNGAWYKTAVIPADQSSLSVGTEVYNLSQAQLRAVIEKDAAHPDTATAQKVGDMYNAFMDEARVEQVGDAPLKADLSKVREISDKAGMARYMGHSLGAFGSSVFGAYVDPDAKSPTDYAFILVQGGIGMPDRDYYLKPELAAKKAAYQAYVARALNMAGWADADAAAKDIVALETRIAEAHWPVEQRRDTEKTYNPMTVAALKAATPGFDWDAWMDGAGVSRVQKVVVSENTAFPKIAAIYAETPLDTLKAWEAFHLIDQASPYLNKAYVDSRFQFVGTALTGQQENRPRWKRAVTLVDGSLGEAVGQEYVKAYFPPEAKAEMEKLVGNLKVAMRGRIQKLAWMSPATKAEALKKLDKMRVRVGYPNVWRNYDGLQVDRNDLYGSVTRSNAFEWAYTTGRLGKPVDQEEWYMTPQTVNAYSDGSRNVIVFPAAILQPPYFDMKADPAVNYGSIGGVIGHEITHAFDDQGRKTDAEGRLRDWWTAEDAKRFEAEAAKLGAQYDTYEVSPGFHVNGKLTMGENIGDLGGVLLGLDAYHAYLNGKPAPVIDGLTGDQRVMMAWAQNWRAKRHLEAEQQQVSSDPHSPSRFRAEAPFRNVDAWYAAWKVEPGQKLYVAPEDRVRIW